VTEYYKGERIDELLLRIALLREALDSNREAAANATEALRITEAYASLAIAKAKLTALQGDK
jgi:hypothetical protein